MFLTMKTYTKKKIIRDQFEEKNYGTKLKQTIKLNDQMTNFAKNIYT